MRGIQLIHIKIPKTKDDFKIYYDLRYNVLREPWGQPRGTEKDDYEPISHHFMAVNDQDKEVVGCVKFFEKEPGVAWVSHLAVKSALQRTGIGRQLLGYVEAQARELGYKKIGCQSRLNTTDYFEKAGYKVHGLPTRYFGTTQVVWMEKEL